MKRRVFILGFGMCLATAPGIPHSLFGQTPGDTIPAVVAAARGVRAKYPDGPAVFIYRGNEALTKSVAMGFGASAEPRPETLSCPSASQPCLLDRVAVALEVRGVVFAGDSATVFIGGLTSSERQAPWTGWMIKLRRTKAAWTVAEVVPLAIS